MLVRGGFTPWDGVRILWGLASGYFEGEGWEGTEGKGSKNQNVFSGARVVSLDSPSPIRVTRGGFTLPAQRERGKP
jgi:hypothetical protein